MAISASIQALLAGELVAGSRLNSKLLDELLAEGLLLVVSRGSRKSYRARDAEALKRITTVSSGIVNFSQSETKRKLPSCGFTTNGFSSRKHSILIPADIESRLKFGSRKRYDEQCNRFKDIKSDILELQQLIDLIHHERKAYDQFAMEKHNLLI